MAFFRPERGKSALPSRFFSAIGGFCARDKVWDLVGKVWDLVGKVWDLDDKAGDLVSQVQDLDDKAFDLVGAQEAGSRRQEAASSVEKTRCAA